MLLPWLQQFYMQLTENKNASNWNLKLYIIVFLKARSGSEKMAYFIKMAFLFMSAESS